jgi:hypothetical protein
MPELVERELAVGRRLAGEAEQPLGHGVALHLGGSSADAVTGETVNAPG